MKKKISYGIDLIICYIISFLTFTKKNRVLFLSDVRSSIGGNLKMMDDYISDTKYEKIYMLKASRDIKYSISEKLKLIFLLSSSEYVLLDDFCSLVSLMRFKKKQKIIQLWHGPGAFKKFGLSRHDKKHRGLRKYMTHRNYSKAIVSSEEIRWCYSEAFGMKEEDIIVTGFPRTDIFFDDKYKKDIKNKFYKRYPELVNKKIIMFCPTYRGVSLTQSYYDFDKLDVDKIYKSLKDEYVFIVKWHPGLRQSEERDTFENKIKKYPKFYYDFTDYRDVNDLLIITDLLITDYSSVIFDYVLLDRPIVYFTYDLKLFEEERGLYYSFSEYVYGKVTKNSDELIKAITSAENNYSERDAFKKKFMSACDGNSTKKTYNKIFEEGDKKCSF